jgi:hypothetical protein
MRCRRADTVKGILSNALGRGSWPQFIVLREEVDNFSVAVCTGQSTTSMHLH